jgi:hypothetical protein
MNEHAAPFGDVDLVQLRREQREVLTVIPPRYRDPLEPAGGGEADLAELDARVLERALRERVAELLTGAELADYLARARRHRFASALEEFVSARHRDLAGDAAEAMEDELERARQGRDATVENPSYEELMLVARIVPLLVWSDRLAR